MYLSRTYLQWLLYELCDSVSWDLSFFIWDITSRIVVNCMFWWIKVPITVPLPISRKTPFTRLMALDGLMDHRRRKGTKMPANFVVVVVVLLLVTVMRGTVGHWLVLWAWSQVFCSSCQLLVVVVVVMSRLVVR